MRDVLLRPPGTPTTHPRRLRGFGFGHNGRQVGRDGVVGGWHV